MVIVPGKFIYVCTPRTASRSVITALWTVPGVIAETAHRHVDPSEALAAQEEHSLPILTFTREPCRHLLSYWWRYHSRRKNPKTFSWFIKNGSVGRFRWPFKTGTRENRLTSYHRVANLYFPLERGVEAFFKEWQLVPEKINLIAENTPGPDPEWITEEHRKLTEEWYAEDVALYKRWTNGLSVN